MWKKLKFSQRNEKSEDGTKSPQMVRNVYVRKVYGTKSLAFQYLTDAHYTCCDEQNQITFLSENWDATVWQIQPCSSNQIPVMSFLYEDRNATRCWCKVSGSCNSHDRKYSCFTIIIKDDHMLIISYCILTTQIHSTGTVNDFSFVQGSWI